MLYHHIIYDRCNICVQIPNPGKPSRGGQAENSKAQISNTKQITMTEIKNPKHAQDIEKRTYQNYS
jgi:hypothetical protein